MHPAKAFTLKHSRKIGIILALLIFASTWYVMNPASGATYTWDNDSLDGLWSTCANWSGDTCPGSADIAQFTSATTSDSIVDASFMGSVAGVDINSGYTGTITQQRNLTIGTSHYDQADGTWKQGTTAFDMNDGNFVLTGGTFETGIGTTTLTDNFTLSGGTYTSSSSRVINFDGDSLDNPNFTCSGVFPSTVKLSANHQSNDFTLLSGCEINKWGSFSSNSGSFAINGGATASIGNLVYYGASLTISGTLNASSTIDLYNDLTLNASGVLNYDGTSIYLDNNYTDNGGTFDASGVTLFFQGGTSQDSVMTCPSLFTGSVDLDKTHVSADFTLSGLCRVDGWVDVVTSGDIIVNGSATANFGNQTISADQFSVSGTARASSTINANLFTLGSGSVFEFDGSTIYVSGNYTDSAGNFNESGVTVVFDGTAIADDTLMTCSGTFSGDIDVTKTHSGATFTLDSSCSVSAIAVTSSGPLTINGTLDTNGNILTGSSLSVGGSGKLILVGNETITSPSLSAGATIEYDGTGTYSSLIAGYDYTHLQFTGGGTYNISNAMTVSGNFTSTNDSNFNHTSNTVTFDGTTQTLTMGNGSFNNLVISSGTTTLSTDTLDVNGFLTIAVGAALDVSVGGCGGSCNIELAGNWSNSGNYVERTGTLTLDGVSQSLTGETTFYTLSKSVAVADTLTFEAGATFTVNNVLVLSGAASNLLSLVSSAPGDIWNISASGSNDLSYLSVTDSTNIDDELLVPTNSIDGGNNTNWYIYVPPAGDGSTGGTFLQGGLELRGNVFLR